MQYPILVSHSALSLSQFRVEDRDELLGFVFELTEDRRTCDGASETLDRIANDSDGCPYPTVDADDDGHATVNLSACDDDDLISIWCELGGDYSYLPTKADVDDGEWILPLNA